jgi:hypothetical protein
VNDLRLVSKNKPKITRQDSNNSDISNADSELDHLALSYTYTRSKSKDNSKTESGDNQIFITNKTKSKFDVYSSKNSQNYNRNPPLIPTSSRKETQKSNHNHNSQVKQQQQYPLPSTKLINKKSQSKTCSIL